MRQINITITGVGLTPEWETLQQVIVQASHTEGKLTRIHKQAGCDYRGPGTYDLDFTPTQGDLIKVKFEVQER
jgi:hypothetical protein